MEKVTEETEKEEEGVEQESRLYEISYLLVPLLTSEQASQETETIKAFLMSQGAEVLHEGAPKTIKLAYRMDTVLLNKRSVYESAYFCWIKFSIRGSGIAEIKKFFSENTSIIRFLITKTIKETPVARPFRTIPRRAPTPLAPRPKTEGGVIDEAQLDKEIEELLIS